MKLNILRFRLYTFLILSLLLREYIGFKNCSVNTYIKCGFFEDSMYVWSLCFLKNRMLLQQSLYWTGKTTRVEHLFTFAVADGNVTVADVLTSYESCNITSYDNLFRTPLHWAALLGGLNMKPRTNSRRNCLSTEIFRGFSPLSAPTSYLIGLIFNWICSTLYLNSSVVC